MSDIGLVSVIVPARDAAATIECQLAALAAQRHAGAWEVVIADNGSTDRTREVAEPWLARLPAASLVDASARRGPAHARNVGARAARGDVLAFCDADDRVAPGWIAALARAASEADIVAGRLQAVGDPDVLAWHGAFRSDGPVVGHRHLPFASGGNSAVRRDLFDRLDGFDEELLAGEDIDLAWRAQAAGHRLAFAQDAVVEVSLPSSLAELARQQRRYGRANAALYRRHAAAGMPRRSVGHVAAAYALLLARVPGAAASRRGRAALAAEAALAWGHLAGSARERVLFA